MFVGVLAGTDVLVGVCVAVGVFVGVGVGHSPEQAVGVGVGVLVSVGVAVGVAVPRLVTSMFTVSAPACAAGSAGRPGDAGEPVAYLEISAVTGTVPVPVVPHSTCGAPMPKLPRSYVGDIWILSARRRRWWVGWQIGPYRSSRATPV